MEGSHKWIFFGVGVAAGALFALSRRRAPIHYAVINDLTLWPVIHRLKLQVPELTQATLTSLTQKRGEFDLKKFFGLLGTSTFSVIYSDSTTSTNTLLSNSLRELPYSGCILYVADRQTSGQGRTGQWISPEGCLMFSHVYTCEIRNALAVQVVIPLAILRSIKCLLGKSKQTSELLQVKWPNDVYLDNKKIAGVLVDSDTVNGQCRMVIGVGLNVFNKTPSTCLDFYFPGIFTREALLAQYLQEFEALTQSLPLGLDAIEAEYASNWMHFNKPARYNGKVLTLVGLNLAEGSLVGKTADGQEISVRTREDLEFITDS